MCTIHLYTPKRAIYIHISFENDNHNPFDYLALAKNNESEKRNKVFTYYSHASPSFLVRLPSHISEYSEYEVFKKSSFIAKLSLVKSSNVSISMGLPVSTQFQILHIFERTRMYTKAVSKAR